MTESDKIQQLKHLLGESCKLTEPELAAFLNQAKLKILDRRFPYGYKLPCEVEPRYEGLQIELAGVLYAQQGAEGQSNHSENGVSRSWRSIDEILNEITPMASLIK